MASRILATILSLIVALVSSAAPRARAEGEARAELRRFRPAIRWHPVLRVDINCDGLVDEIFTGRDAERFYVAAVMAGSSPRRISITGFRLRGESQDSFCGDPSLLEKERMDYDPTEAVGDVPEGFRRSRRCFGLRLVAGECDSFHLFWNHTAKELNWWRQ